MTTLSELHPFTAAYIEAALWSSMDGSDPNTGGDPLDANYTVDDIAEPTLRKMVEDCTQFLTKNMDLIECWDNERYTSEEMAGHDFWLTRNGHGSGFWDGDWPKAVGEYLTEQSKTYGEFDLYVGDDGKIYALGAEE